MERGGAPEGPRPLSPDLDIDTDDFEAVVQAINNALQTEV